VLFRSASTADRKAPFPGVPVVLKDSLTTSQAGIPYFAGSRLLKAKPYVAKTDSPIGRRLRDAGFITVGVSKTPELCWYTTTQPTAFGPTRNPWNLKYSVGGSSGGSGAALASNMVPIASGTEDGGSIRIPASFCGVVGLKPTRGLVPNPEPHTYHLLHTFIMSRTVRDTGALLDFVGGSDSRSLFGFGAGGSRANRNLNVMLPPLKVGIARTMGGVEAHAECQRAVDAAIPMLRDLGFQVSEGATPLISADDRETRILLSRVYARRAFCSFEQLVGRKIKRDEVEPFVWDSARPDEAGPSAEEFLAAFERRRTWAAEAMSWWNENDLLLTPTVCEPPVTIESRANETLEQTHVTEARQMAFCAPFDETGQPSISLPLHWTADGLPVGVQLVADMGRDDLLLAVASRLETIMPWSHRQPPAVRDIAQSVKGAKA